MSLTMAALESQVVDPKDFIPILDYSFSGDNPTVEKKRAFVLAYREHGSIYHAAIASRIHRSTYYDWIDRDPVFLQAVEDCKEDCSDQVESSVFKKAVNGSTLDAIFYLKAHRPKFRDRVTIDIESVKDEIQQRMAQAGVNDLRQLLPPTVTEFVESESESESVDVSGDLQAISPPPSLNTKRDDE